MLSDLNSVLMEGKVYQVIERDADIIFTLTSARIEKDITILTDINIIIKVKSSKVLIDKFKEFYSNSSSKKIRVVGRLVQENSQIAILAEHIEFK